MTNYIYKGFYLRKTILCKYELENIKIGSFDEIEIDDPEESCPYENASDFLMGSCQLFAYELNRKYGYPIYEINYKGQMIHCFCIVNKDETIYYIDVRGVTSDYSEFLLETNVSENDDFIIQTIDVTTNEEWDALGLKFAQSIIERHPKYYEI